MVKINGTQLDAAGKTVAELLDEQGYHPTTVAVERNEAILPKAKYGSTVLQDGDVIEIVSFVGGG